MEDGDPGFRRRARRRGEVVITHRGRRAAAFLEEVEAMAEPARQQEMARPTGDYRRGGEREARSHPRNA